MKRFFGWIPVVLGVLFNQLNAQTQVTDLSSDDVDNSSSPRDFVQFNNLLLFTAYDDHHGREIWVSDGTKDNTRLLKDIYPGNSTSTAFYYSFETGSVILDNKLFFVANDGEYSNQLWSTDGTTEGTVRVTNLPYLTIFKLTVVGDHIYFLGQVNNRLQVWKSDGTNEGTSLIKKDIPIVNTPSFQGTAGNLFFFTFQEEGTFENRVWRSDGTDSGTFPVTNGVSTGHRSPHRPLAPYIEFNNQLYFVGRNSSMFSNTSSIGIITTDGSLENTDPVKAILDESSGYEVASVIKIDNKLYFSFFEFDGYRQVIWESDGTESGTKKIYDESGVKFYIPSNLNTDGVDLIFTGKNSQGETALLKLNVSNYEVEEIKELVKDAQPPFDIPYPPITPVQINKLTENLYHLVLSLSPEAFGWISDLSTTNTVQIEELINIFDLAYYEQGIYYPGYNEQTGAELWKSDDTFNSPVNLLNINKSKINGIRNQQLEVINDKVLFARNNNVTGNELWAYDDINANAFLLKNINDSYNYTYSYNRVRYNDFIYFGDHTIFNGLELWRTDGTENGTTMFSELAEGTDDSRPNNLTVHKGELYFSATIGSNDFLYKTDGETTTKIKDLEGMMRGMVSSGEDLYFLAGKYRTSLWKSDGTEHGTVLIEGIDFLATANLTAVDGKVFFLVYEGPIQFSELWYSDGTSEGTIPLKETRGRYEFDPPDFGVLGNQLIFTAYSPEFGHEYWKSDGTVEGTIPIADINPGNKGSVNHNGYAVLDDFIYFAADDGTHGVELWKTDGTTEGTTMVADINEGAEGSNPGHLVSDGQKVYFSAYSKESGMELWVSEGEASNTKQLHDVIDGPLGSAPSGLVFLEDELFFTAETINSGRQLWKSSDDMTTVTSINSPGNEEHFKVFPNPASDYLYMNSKEFTVNDLAIFNLQGRKIVTSDPGKNRIYTGDLPQGIYVLVVTSDRKTITRKFIKR